MFRWAHRLVLAALVMWVVAVPSPVLAGKATPTVLDPASFSPVVSHPYFPLASVGYKVLEGDFVDQETGETTHERVEERVLPETVTIAGIEATVVEVNEFADGELTEHTLDYYAQHVDGTVYYLGEDVDKYEDGELESHEGAWRAGEGENQAGVFLPPTPTVGMVFEQERAPGIAEDRSTVVAVDVEITVAAGRFGGCIRTEDVNPIDGATEFKVYCPDVGIVREEDEEGSLELIEYEPHPPVATPAG